MMSQLDHLATWLKARLQSERGASLVEYALLVAFIAVVAVLAITFIGGETNSSFESTGSGFRPG